jgi:Autotransporter beta-domain
MPNGTQKASTTPLSRAAGKYVVRSRLAGGILAVALNLASAAPAAALLCSTADPRVVPGGTVLNTIASDTINSILGVTATPAFLTGSTSYTLTNSQPFIAGRTFVYNPSQLQSGAVGSFTLPLAQLRGLTREQYLDYFALPNFPNTPRNNAIALVVIPAGTQFWSGPTGPITDPATGLFWGNGGGLQYFVGRQVIGSFQVPTSNYVLPTPDNGGPVLVYGPRLSGNARAIGSYLDQRCVAAYSDLDQVLTSLDVLNLANPTNAGPLAAAVGQLSPDRYGALPLIIGRQHTLILDAFGGRIDATRWPYADPQVNQHAIAPGAFLWGRVLGDFGERDDSSTMPGYRTTTGGGLGGLSYADGDGRVFGIGGGYLRSSATWRDIGASTGDITTGVLGAYGGTNFGRLLIDGALAGTYSFLDVNRRIVIPDAGLGNTRPLHRHLADREWKDRGTGPRCPGRCRDEPLGVPDCREALCRALLQFVEPAWLHRDQCRQHQFDDGRQGQRRPAVAGRGRRLLPADGRRPVRLGVAGESGLDPPPVGHLGRYHGRAGGPAWKLHDPDRGGRPGQSPAWAGGDRPLCPGAGVRSL